MRRLVLLLLLLVTQRLSAQWTSESCPLPNGLRGYPVVARSAEVDSATLLRIARAATSSWPGDTARIDKPQPLATARTLLTMAYPTVPRRNSWKPRASDTATILLRYHRVGVPEVIVDPEAQKFGRQVAAALENELLRARLGFVQHDTIPLAVISRNDWVDVTIRFGYEPEPHDAVSRYSVMEREVTPPRNANGPTYPEGLRQRSESGSATVTFLVLPDGTVDKGSIHFVESTHREFELAVEEFLNRRLVFGPAMVDCVPVAKVVRQPFRFWIGGKSPRGTLRPRP